MPGVGPNRLDGKIPILLSFTLSNYLGLKLMTLLVFEIITPALRLSVATTPTSGAALTASAVVAAGF